MNCDYNKLRGRIREVFGSEKCFAQAMQMSAPTLSAKLNGFHFFTQKEILRAIQLLKLDDTDIPEYFFCVKTSAS